MSYLVFFCHTVTRQEQPTTPTHTPKPILEMLGNPKCLKFVIKDRHVKVRESD